MEVLLYICIFFCGWVCHSFFSYIMSLGYSVMLLRNLLRDIVYMMARVVEVAYLIHEIKMIELSRASLSDKERENHVKLHEIQMGNLKRDIVGSITRNLVDNLQDQRKQIKRKQSLFLLKKRKSLRTAKNKLMK